MGHKRLIFRAAAREKVLRGAAALADAVRVTLGPKSKSVPVEKCWGRPIVCNDGVTIAKEVDLEDPEENLGARMLREAAERTGDAVGDGSSTSTVLAHAILAEGVRNVAAGASAVDHERCGTSPSAAVSVATRVLTTSRRRCGRSASTIVRSRASRRRERAAPPLHYRGSMRWQRKPRIRTRTTVAMKFVNSGDEPMAAKERDRFRFRKEQGRSERTDRKRRQTIRRADDARPNGLVEIPGPFTEEVREDIVRTARNVEEREAERRQGAKILRISAWEEGLVIETEEEKLAQMIGEAIGKSRNAEIDRLYDDEGMRRVVVCRLPGARSGA